MYERHNTTVAVFGGDPNVPIQFGGMAGYQTLTWTEFQNEIKTANLQDVRTLEHFQVLSCCLSY